MAIISVITVPIVLNIIDRAKSGAMLESARGVKKALETYYFSYDIAEESFNGHTCIFPDDCDEIKIDGEVPSGGQLVIDNKGNIDGILQFSNKYNYLIKNDEIIKINNFISVGQVFNYAFTSDVQTLDTIPGYYKLEVWGAQGGDANDCIGGYGGYSVGIVNLDKEQKIYVVVGEKGIISNNSADFVNGGYNGGGSANYNAGTGGGCTHISKNNKLLSNMSDSISDILIVAGGGGGSGAFGSTTVGGSAGGKIGQNGGNYSSSYLGAGFGGTQDVGGNMGSISIAGSNFGSAGNFGLGGNGGYESAYKHGSGAGGCGFYGGGGGSARNGGGGGGSGYIGNGLLKDKAMYCFNCDESSDVDTLTYSIEEFDSEPISGVAKVGDGYARITYLGLKY